MISKVVTRVSIKLAKNENARTETLTWSGLFSCPPSKADILAAIAESLEKIKIDHYALHDGDVTADPGGLSIKLRQIDCFRQVMEYWDGEKDSVWIHGYLKLADVDIAPTIPIWFNEEH